MPSGVEEREERQPEWHQLADRPVRHATLVEEPRRRVEIGSRGDTEAEVVEPDPERVDAIPGGGSLGVDGPMARVATSGFRSTPRAPIPT